MYNCSDPVAPRSPPPPATRGLRPPPESHPVPETPQVSPTCPAAVPGPVAPTAVDHRMAIKVVTTISGMIAMGRLTALAKKVIARLTSHHVAQAGGPHTRGKN